MMPPHLAAITAPLVQRGHGWELPHTTPAALAACMQSLLASVHYQTVLHTVWPSVVLMSVCGKHRNH